MAEQRVTGPHQGQFIEEEDDLLALSSDDEEEHRVVSYLQLSEIYGIPETDDPREKWAIYCAQCMVAVVERYHRHQQTQPWREAMQLVRILHAYNGSGPSRRIISSLQRAMREGTATPEVFRAGRLLMDTLTEVLTAHRPREQPLLALFVQFREAISRAPPFNGEISDPSKVFLNWERTLTGQPRAPKPAPASHQPWQRSGWTQMSFTPMRSDIATRVTVTIRGKDPCVSSL